METPHGPYKIVRLHVRAPLKFWRISTTFLGAVALSRKKVLLPWGVQSWGRTENEVSQINRVWTHKRLVRANNQAGWDTLAILSNEQTEWGYTDNAFKQTN